MAGRLVLCIGDLFIPDRAPDIPTKFKKLLAPGKIGQVLCLGNLTDGATFEFLRGLAPDLQIVRGDFDVDAPNLALSRVVQHGSLRIGFTHGHTIVPQGDADALLIAARQMDVDVLLWGGTHKFEAYEMEGKFFINPGSATGATSTSSFDLDEPTPSFALMDVQGEVLVVYVYQLKKDDKGEEKVSVEKVSFRKGAAALTQSMSDYSRGHPVSLDGGSHDDWSHLLSEGRKPSVSSDDRPSFQSDTETAPAVGERSQPASGQALAFLVSIARRQKKQDETNILHLDSLSPKS